MSSQIPEEKRVLEANIVLHTVLAETYDADQPHFRPENIARVEHNLAEIAAQTGGGILLDLGTGTGFVLNIARKYFQTVIGVDVTTAMLNLVDTSTGNIELIQGETGKLPIADSSVSVCTAYSFLHHLYDLRPTLQESLRCLQDGGIFYAEQDPNYHYWQLMDSVKDRSDLPPVVRREVDSVVSITDEISGKQGIEPDAIAMAEYQKVMKGGFDGDALISLMKDIGFDTVTCRYEWYMGQGKVRHEQSSEHARIVEDYLRAGLPATRYLFKYLSLTARKGSV